jgi:uncharacterized tellurite resistance protein B-like protein
MLNRLKAFFGDEAEPAAVDDEAALHLAAAVLLVQVAKSDHQIESLELERVKQVLRDQWSIDDADLTDLMAVADATTEEHVSLHAQVDRINSSFSPTQKCSLVRGLWDVACADGEIHHYEELLVRRLADLIYVPHADFIRTKHEALAAAR